MTSILADEWHASVRNNVPSVKKLPVYLSHPNPDIANQARVSHENSLKGVPVIQNFKKMLIHVLFCSFKFMAFLNLVFRICSLLSKVFRVFEKVKHHCYNASSLLFCTVQWSLGQDCFFASSHVFKKSQLCTKSVNQICFNHSVSSELIENLDRRHVLSK